MKEINLNQLISTMDEICKLEASGKNANNLRQQIDCILHATTRSDLDMFEYIESSDDFLMINCRKCDEVVGIYGMCGTREEMKKDEQKHLKVCSE